MNASDEDHLDAVAELVNARMVRFEVQASEICKLAHVSAETLRRIRQGLHVSDAKLRAVSRSLAWTSDLLVRIAHGEEVSEDERQQVHWDELEATLDQERTRVNQHLDGLRQRIERAERLTGGR